MSTILISKIAKVRRLTGDLTVPYHFTDAEIAGFLSVAALDITANDVFLSSSHARKAWDTISKKHSNTNDLTTGQKYALTGGGETALHSHAGGSAHGYFPQGW